LTFIGVNTFEAVGCPRKTVAELEGRKEKSSALMMKPLPSPTKKTIFPLLKHVSVRKYYAIKMADAQGEWKRKLIVRKPLVKIV
jgi:hypothetical protein